MAKPEELITTDLARIRAVVEGAKYLSVDAETNGTHPITHQTVGVGILSDLGAVYVPTLAHVRMDGSKCQPVDLKGLADIMRPALQSVPVLGHNLKFDCHCFWKLGWGFPKYPICTMVAFWLLSEDSELGLKQVASAIVGQELPDYDDHRRMALDWRKAAIDQMRQAWVADQKQLYGRKITDARREVATVLPYPILRDLQSSDVPLELLGVYCLKDCAYTAHLWLDVLRPCLAVEDLLGYYYSYEAPFIRVLWGMEQAGVAIDPQKFAAQEQELTAKIAALESRIYDLIGHAINLDSHAQKCKCFFEELGFEPPSIKTDSGQPALSEHAIRELHERYAEQTELFELLLDRTEAVKLREFTVKLPAEAVNGRIHSNFKQTGTATGRLSCTDPNIQQIPKESSMRSGFVATPGYKLIKSDLSQAELRWIADLAGDVAYLKVFRQDGDPHQQLQDALGIQGPDARRISKTINFGVNYGLSAFSFRKRLLWDARIVKSQQECDGYFAAFNKLHAELEPWKQRLWKEAAERGFVQTRLGRRRRAPDINSDDREERGFAQRQVANTPVQGGIADYVKCVMIRLQADLEPLGGRIVLQAHDELVCEVPEDIAPEAARMVQWHMTHVFKDLLVEMKCDVGIGDDWYDADRPDNKIKD